MDGMRGQPLVLLVWLTGCCLLVRAWAFPTITSASQQQEGRIVESIDVICPSDRKVGGGRGKRQEPVPVKRVALAHGLDVFHTPPELCVALSGPWFNAVLLLLTSLLDTLLTTRSCCF